MNHSTIKSALHEVISGQNLSRDQAADVCMSLLRGEGTPVEISGLLCALHARGETIDELSGFLSAIRANMISVHSNDLHVIDVCGTGGDGSQSFNLSTAAGLLAAACGATVAKHGNRAVSSNCGSADFIEALGISFHEQAVTAAEDLMKRRFAFLFALHFHPAMKRVAPVRKELGVRSIFNLLGPLANPVGVKKQLIGVFDKKWLRLLVETLAEFGSTEVIAVHGEGGLDEICLDGATYYCMLKNGNVTEGAWYASSWGLQTSPRNFIKGTSAAENAAKLLSVAQNNETELRGWIIANTVPALMLSGHADSPESAVTLAKVVIKDGVFSEFLIGLRAVK